MYPNPFRFSVSPAVNAHASLTAVISNVLKNAIILLLIVVILILNLFVYLLFADKCILKIHSVEP